MGLVVSAPTYLYQSPSGYIFRLRIPNDLRRIVGKCEFRYSLRTGALRVAKHRARSIASYIHQLFTRVRSSMAEFTQEKIQEMVKKYIRETLARSLSDYALFPHIFVKLEKIILGIFSICLR